MSEKPSSEFVSFEEFQARRKQKIEGPEASLKGRFDASTGQPVSHITQEEQEVPPRTRMSDEEYTAEDDFNKIVIDASGSSRPDIQGKLQ